MKSLSLAIENLLVDIMFHYDLDEIKEFASGWTVEHSAELHNLYKEYLPFSIQTMVKLIRNR